MPSFDATLRRFGPRIVIPAILVLIGTIATVIIALGSMAGEVNRIETQLTTRSADAAVHSLLRHMADTHGDYAIWDDAARNLYGDVNQDFVDESFVSSTADPIFFDTTYLLDADGHMIFGYRDGERINVPPAEAFGPALAGMMAKLPADGRTEGVESGLVKGKWGLAVMAVGPVVPFSPTYPTPPTKARFLILAKAFDQDAVARLSRDYVIDGLRFVGPKSSVPFKVDLTDPDGTVIGALTWAGPSLGSEAHAKVSPFVVFMLLLLTLTTGVLISVAIRSLNELRNKEKRAVHEATHDALTSLPNRRALIDAIGDAIGKRRKEGSTVAIAYLDLDGFKEINDAYGHHTGDALLRWVAEAFRSIAGDRFLARIGGDEFAVLIEGGNPTNSAPALGVAFIRLLSEPINLNGRMMSVGTSVGIAIADAGEIAAEELLRRADVAMYEAKQQGRNRIYVYHSSIDTIRHERLEIAADLRRALKSNALELAYQPVFNIRTGNIVAVEALARWNRPGRGPLPPSVFVPIAEESGLIDELGAWTLWRACHDAAAWPDVRLAVNASPAQFRNSGFEQLISKVLSNTGFPPQRLEVEMTESYFVSHPEQARSAIEAIRNLGIAVVLDDFGTGYSSIGYLRAFNFSKIKLDRSMIAGVDMDKRAQRLVQATVSLADALDLRVTAEGVETEHEVAILKAAGCVEFQGFYFARPCSAAEMTEMLARQSTLTTPRALIA